MIENIRKFRKLDTEMQSLVVQAACNLGIMRFVLVTKSFRKITSEFTCHELAFESEELGPESLASARKIGWSVRTAARFTPWDSACLVQVLAAQRMLRQRRIAGVIYVGAKPLVKREVRSGITGHAWLRCGPEFVTGQAGHSQFTIISTFSWDGSP